MLPGYRGSRAAPAVQACQRHRMADAVRFTGSQVWRQPVQTGAHAHRSSRLAATSGSSWSEPDGVSAWSWPFCLGNRSCSRGRGRVASCRDSALTVCPALVRWFGPTHRSSPHCTAPERRARWRTNESLDVDPLSVAVPRCDVVVTQAHAYHVPTSRSGRSLGGLSGRGRPPRRCARQGRARTRCSSPPSIRAGAPEARCRGLPL